MSQMNVTSTTLPVTVVCDGALSITVTFVTSSTCGVICGHRLGE